MQNEATKFPIKSVARYSVTYCHTITFWYLMLDMFTVGNPSAVICGNSIQCWVSTSLSINAFGILYSKERSQTEKSWLLWNNYPIHQRQSLKNIFAVITLVVFPRIISNQTIRIMIKWSIYILPCEPWSTFLQKLESKWTSKVE